MSPLKPLPYHFVDSTSTAAGSSRVSANADSVAAAVDVSTIETDVRYLAAPELQGRLRGTEGNARARAQIVASLEAAGLAPLFSDSFGRAPWLLRRALAADRRRVEKLLQSWDQGVSPTPKSYRVLQLASIRIQAALWHPSGWWFALW